MNVADLVFIDSTGYHLADYPTFLTWIQDQYRAIYGADVYLESDSQDGQFLAILAQGFFDTGAVGQSVYNSFRPGGAQGVGLSRVVKINGISRRIPTHSTVVLTIGGTAGTVITNGIAQDTLNQHWLLPATVTIPNAATIDVTATAEDLGAIQAQAHTVTTIFTPTRGWLTVDNAAIADPGQPVETDAQLRIRQTQSTLNPSLTVLDGTVGAVANVTGVTRVAGYENDTNTTDGNSIPPHSIAMIVEGGDQTVIAETIALHKTPGTGTSGVITVLVYDAHEMPLNIKFSRPTLVTINVDITLSTNAAWSADYAALIQNAVADSINALGIGQDVLITRLFAPAYLNGTLPGQSYDIVTLQIYKTGNPPGTSNIAIAFNELPVCDPSTDVTVTT